MRYLTIYDVDRLRWWATYHGGKLTKVKHVKTQQKWSANANTT